MKPLILLLSLAMLAGCAAKQTTHSACLKPHYGFWTTHAEILDRLGYCGEHRGVFVIGEDRCYTNDVRVPYWKQKDLRCY
ncbi:MAG: hypothetical protein ACLPLR_06135 [Terriglobales bacterium]